MTFTAAMSKYFGRREGQTLSDFQKELSALTPEDKIELRPLLEAALGETVDPPAGLPAAGR